MHEARASHNRRRESRYYAERGALVAWRQDGRGARRRKGWLNEISDSGMSFLVNTPREPHRGEDLMVDRKRGGGFMLFHVVHTTALEGGLSLVGCRLDMSEPCSLNRRSRPRLSASKRLSDNTNYFTQG